MPTGCALLAMCALRVQRSPSPALLLDFSAQRAVRLQYRATLGTIAQRGRRLKFHAPLVPTVPWPAPSCVLLVAIVWAVRASRSRVIQVRVSASMRKCVPPFYVACGTAARFRVRRRRRDSSCLPQRLVLPHVWLVGGDCVRLWILLQRDSHVLVPRVVLLSRGSA